MPSWNTGRTPATAAPGRAFERSLRGPPASYADTATTYGLAGSSPSITASSDPSGLGTGRPTSCGAPYSGSLASRTCTK